MRTCHFHPDRPGIGICMRCRKAICAACCTRVNGINHCHACLKLLSGQPNATSGGYLGTLLAGILFAVGWLILSALCWAMSGKMAP